MKAPPPPPPPPKQTKAAPPPLAFGKIPEGPTTSRVIMNCAEGWGKTTMMAYAPKPLVVMAPNESGLVTLRKTGRVPDIPVARPSSWPELLDLVRSQTLHDFDTVGFDALGGLEQLCRDHVLARDFGGDETKFQSFGRGNATLAAEWMVLIAALEKLAEHATVILASHVGISSFNNPSGDNYGYYVGDCTKQVWASTKRWADGVLFGTFFTTVAEGKAKGGTQRIVYTEHRATHDAKNRWGMPAMIQIPDDPAKIYETVFSHINKEPQS